MIKKLYQSYRIAISPNSHTLKDSVCVVSQYVIQLIRHTTRARDIGNTKQSPLLDYIQKMLETKNLPSWSVKLTRQYIVHHSTGVSDLKASRLDSTYGSRSNYHHSFVSGQLEIIHLSNR